MSQPYNQEIRQCKVNLYQNPQIEHNFKVQQQLNNESLYANSRNGFIKKVYTLLSIQIIITFLVCSWAMIGTSFKSIFVNLPMVIILNVLLILLLIVIACFNEALKKYGAIVFILFTLLLSILVGIVCAQTKAQIVIVSAAITCVVVIALTIYACKYNIDIGLTDTDFTGCGPYLLIFSLVFLSFGIGLIFWRSPMAHLIYACIGVLFFSIYLIHDTQLVLGKFGTAYSIDDHYMAAIQLYMDIIQIFLKLMQALSQGSN